MKLFFTVLFTCLFVTTFGQVVINDKNAELRQVGPFNGIRVSGGFDVYLSQGKEHAVAVSGSEKRYTDNIKVEVENGILVVSYAGGSLTFNEKRNLRAYISFKDLQSIEGSGACDIKIQDQIESNTLRVRLSGACEIKGNINIANLDVNLAGASTSKLEGRVDNVRIDASGASDLKNYNLVVSNCIAQLSGASDVKITVNNSLSVKASGASTLNYRGNPQKTEINTSGASSASQKN